MQNKHSIEMTPEERVDTIITEWKRRRVKDEEETAKKFASPKYQEIFKKLAEQNEQRKKRIAAR